MSDEIEVPLPILGVNEDLPLAKQPPGTARDSLNCRAFDSGTGRKRVSKRPGIKDNFNSERVSGANPVRAMEQLTFPTPIISFSEHGNGSEVNLWTADSEEAFGDTTDSIVTDVKVDQFDNLYALNSKRGVAKYSFDGVLVSTITVPSDAEQLFLRTVEVDEALNVYICGGVGPNASQAQSRIWKYVLTIDPYGAERYELDWEIDSGRFFNDFQVVNPDTIYAVEYQSSSAESVTASTISFDATDNSINDSGSGLGSFEQGDRLVISGTASNDTNLPIVDSVAAGKLIVRGFTIGPSTFLTFFATGNLILDTDANAFIDVAVGDTITISGSAVNDGEARVVNKINDGLIQVTDKELVNEASGSSVTITVGYVLTTEAAGSSFTVTAISEGYLRRYRDIRNGIAPIADLEIRIDDPNDNGLCPWSLAARDDGVVYVALSDDGLLTANTKSGFLYKYNTGGDTPETVIWKFDHGSSNDSPGDAESLGGVGLNVAIGPDGELISVGQGITTTGAQTIRRLVDNGDTLTQSGGDTWDDWPKSTNVLGAAKTSQSPASASAAYRPPIHFDQDGRIYFGGFSAGGTYEIRVYDDAGGGSVATDDVTNQGTVQVAGIATATTIPNYFGASVNIAEKVFVGYNQPSTTNKNLQAWELVGKTIDNSEPPRKTVIVAVANGDIRQMVRTIDVDPVGPPVVGGSNVIDSGGTFTGEDRIDTSALYVSTAVLFGKVYITDGLNVFVYDPRAESQGNELAAGATDDTFGTVDTLKAKRGSVPERPALVFGWLGRLGFAREYENPQSWTMSKVGEPDNFDLSPPVRTVQQAVRGVDSDIGPVPDIINTVIPYSNDFLIFGCDKELHRMTGDPAAGGAYDRLTDKVGMAFGKPWAKDQAGVLYFMDTNAEVWAWSPGQNSPVSLSENSIQRQLSDEIDFTTHHVRLEWDVRNEGLLIFQLPYGAGGTSVKAWFWDRKNGNINAGWWPMRIGTTSSTTAQPSALTVVDGDRPGDRRVVLGSESGFVFQFDDDQTSDGGIRFDSFVDIMLPHQPRRSFLYSGFQAMTADDLSSVPWQVFATDRADRLPTTPAAEGEFPPGRSPYFWDRVWAEYAVMRIGGTQRTERWAIEELSCTMAPAGMARRSS